MPLPFDGAISAFRDDEAPEALRDVLDEAGKKDIPNPDFPYEERWDKDDYHDAMEALQVELVKLQAWVKESGARVAILFEGRDAAGKGGTIKRFRENLNTRGARTVALPKPTKEEAGQWYFQRYVAQLPSPGEIVFFDRSWYNRAVVEPVFDFATEAQVARFYDQVEPFERMLTDDGILLFKIWLNVGRATQLRRFLARERDPLKQWKLSWIDVEGLRRWDSYTNAIETMLNRTDFGFAPWIVLRSDDKRRARVNAIRSVLARIDYAEKDGGALGEVDGKIAGGADLWAR
ncbi:polyphosphate kinase 2 [Pseudoroseicyclus aestuarii]|uniref:ADP/GDP-polyphosphate phosphotransferase n=1 Tax=Pseudoroseicyclus aestuarii TaxID=1795041 RepID=A0A318SWD3_9RHOB|nr:polyphosphate kinase 2 [Pseudoroseicyclus aestuarii]PYE86190.1 polyphosphate kinase 2 [Pseudoroseicyclus aestuarii]